MYNKFSTWDISTYKVAIPAKVIHLLYRQKGGKAAGCCGDFVSAGAASGDDEVGGEGGYLVDQGTAIYATKSHKKPQVPSAGSTSHI